MTMVTEGGMEMNREEKKEWLEKHKNKIKLKLNCICLSCYSCPYHNSSLVSRCEAGELQKEREERDDLMIEVLAEAHGYIKKQETDIEKIVVDPSKIGPTITVKDTTDKQLNPDHYKVGKLQAIEQMIIVFGPSKVANFCEVNAFKYHARAGLKGDASLDHKKADWYMRAYDRLKMFGCMDGEKALEALREFLKEENENAADH